jgi:hypothetical protein
MFLCKKRKKTVFTVDLERRKDESGSFFTQIEHLSRCIDDVIP